MQCGTLFSFEQSDNLCRTIWAPVYLRPRFYPISSHCRTSDKESEDICLSICHCPLCWSITECRRAYSIPTLTNWKGGYSAKECIKWSTSILPWSRVINMNRPNMEFPEFPSEKSRSKAGAWVRKGLVLSDRKRKLSIQIQIQYKYRSTAHRFSLRCQLKGEILTENILTGCCTSPFLPPPNPDTLVHLVQKRSGCGGTLGAHWYTSYQSFWLVHLCRIATPTP